MGRPFLSMDPYLGPPDGAPPDRVEPYESGFHLIDGVLVPEHLTGDRARLFAEERRAEVMAGDWQVDRW